MAIGTSVGVGPFSSTTQNYGFNDVQNVDPNGPHQNMINYLPTDQEARPNPFPSAPDSTRNSFLPPNYTAPLYNEAGVAGNVGTMLGASAPAAASYLQNLFSPVTNPMENAFLGAGLANAQVSQEQGFNRAESQFEGSPYHSGLTQARGDVMNQTSRDLLSTAGQMGIQRESLANQLAQFPFQGAMEAAAVPVKDSLAMFNLANNAFQQPLQFGSNIWSGINVPSPVVSTGGSDSGGGKSIF